MAINNNNIKNEEYHYGDLSYGGKADSRGIMGNRGTGHFGTGFYALGWYNPEEVGKQYSNRGHWEIDFSKYNVFKPQNVQQAYDLHYALKLVNRLADRDIDKLLSLDKQFDRDQLLNKLDDYEYDFDNNGILMFMQELSPEWCEFKKFEIEDAVEQGKWGALEKIAKELIETLIDNQESLDTAAYELHKIFPQENIDVIRASIINAIRDETNVDSASTVFMKELGYEGVGVSHLGKQVDNLEYGSVVYDLKPGTYKKIAEPNSAID